MLPPCAPRTHERRLGLATERVADQWGVARYGFSRLAGRRAPWRGHRPTSALPLRRRFPDLGLLLRRHHHRIAIPDFVRRSPLQKLLRGIIVVPTADKRRVKQGEAGAAPASNAYEDLERHAVREIAESLFEGRLVAVVTRPAICQWGACVVSLSAQRRSCASSRSRGRTGKS